MLRQKSGHPLVCHLSGSECKSKLRVLKNAIVHYNTVRELKNQLCTCISKFKLIDRIDEAIKECDHVILLEACTVTFKELFNKKKSL